MLLILIVDWKSWGILCNLESDHLYEVVIPPYVVWAGY